MVNSGDWLELFNPGNKEIDLSNWMITDNDISNPPVPMETTALPLDKDGNLDSSHIFFFPPQTKVGTGEYLVVRRNAKNFTATFPSVKNYCTDTLPFGLNGSDRIAVYNGNGAIVTSVNYDYKGAWPSSPNGYGQTLELRNPAFYNFVPFNWGASTIKGGTPGVKNSIYGTPVFKEKSNAIPCRTFLAQNYPNPFKKMTIITFSLPAKDHVNISLFSLAGKNLETIVDGEMNAGVHRIKWVAGNHAPGVYLYRMQTHNFTQIRKANIR